MKNLMNQTAAGVALGLALLAGAIQNSTANATPPTLSMVWGFGNAANPAPPDSATGVLGAPQAAPAPGLFSDGWLEQLAGLPGATGFWDLGNSGSITLHNASGIAGPNTQARTFTVQVVQYHDAGGFYNENTVVSVPGAVQTATTVSTVAASGNFGDWITQETAWTAAAGSPVNSIVINGATAAKHGTVIDLVAVQSRFAPPLGAQLSIRKIGGDDRFVEISWSADYAGMVLQSNGDLGNAAGWAAVEAPPQLSGSTYSITVEAAGAKFYRLKQQ